MTRNYGQGNKVEWTKVEKKIWINVDKIFTNREGQRLTGETKVDRVGMSNPGRVRVGDGYVRSG